MTVMPEQGPLDLTFARRLKAPRHAVWRCWTEPALLKQWFCPRPWYVTAVESDLRPGGIFATTMSGPDGESHAGEGLWIEVVPEEKLTFTNALGACGRPLTLSDGVPYMTAHIHFRDAEDGGTAYTAIVLHRNAAERDAHAAMGFDEGWGAAADQLDALAATL